MLRAFFSRLRQHQKGASLVEGTMVLAFFVVPLVGAGLEAVLYITNHLRAEQTARESVSLVAQFPNTVIDATERTAFETDLSSKGYTVTTTSFCACPADVAASGAAAPVRTCGSNGCGGTRPWEYRRYTISRPYTPLLGWVWGNWTPGSVQSSFAVQVRQPT
jgi:Flp pilus assembly protein TadG